MTRERALRGIRAAQVGLLANAALVVVKLVAGVLGNAYALIADAVESSADIASSLIVWGGLSIAALPPDEDHPFGHGKAEPLAAAIVALMLLGAAVGIAVEAIREIRLPHHVPATWTLVVLVGVMVAKTLLARRVHSVGASIESTAVKADAAHHLSDALTSLAAFVGILTAVLGSRLTGDVRWAQADDWAALVATLVIGWNGATMLRSAMHDLMDRSPGANVVAPIEQAALGVPGVLAIEKVHVRKVGLSYLVTLHVQADALLSLRDSHILGGKVKGAIRAAAPGVESVLVHMEPYEAPADGSETSLKKNAANSARPDSPALS